MSLKILPLKSDATNTIDTIVMDTHPSGNVGITKIMIGASGLDEGLISSANPIPNNLSKVGGTSVDTNSGLKSAGTLRVVIATDQPSLTNPQPVSQNGTWNITNISGTVSLPTGAATESTLSTLNGKITTCNTGAVVLAAGTAAFGKLAANDGIDIGDVTINNASGGSAVNIQDGGNSITVDGSVSISGLVPGTTATSLGKAEDAAAADGDTGVMVLAVRKDIAATTVGADGDYHPLEVDANGRLWVIANINSGQTLGTVTTVGTVTTITNVVHVDDNGASLTVDFNDAIVGTPGSAIPAKGIMVQGSDGTNSRDIATTTSGIVKVDLSGTAGNTTAVKVDGSAVTQPVSVAAGATNIAKAEDAASADADVGVPAMAVRKATPANTSGTDGDYEMLQMSGGRLWTSSVIDTALPAGSNVIGAFKTDQTTHGTTDLVAADITKLAGTTVDTNSGNKSGGTLRTVIATDQPNLTTPLNVVDNPQTSGGLTMSRTISAATTNATSVKASAGHLYHMRVYNLNASPRYLKFYNKASAPTVGSDTPVATEIIPGNTSGAGFVCNIDKGLAFSTGIAFAITGAIGDADTTAISANEVIVNLGYK